MLRILPIIAALVASAIIPSDGAFAADYIDGARPTGACQNTRAINAIIKRFDIQARHVHKDDTLAIMDIVDVRENRFDPATDDLGDSVDRRYCIGNAVFADGRHRTVWYLIEYEEGFAGKFGDNVEFCISGLDRWNVYNNSCRVLR